MDIINDLNKKFIDHQEKFVYYVVALSVTCIGFSIYSTSGKALSPTQIPLALAILCWGMSILCGLKFIRRSTSILREDVDYLHLIGGSDPIAGNDQLLIEEGKRHYEQTRKKTERILTRLFKLLERGFYSGVIFFVTWHVLQMYYLGTCPSTSSL
jgi:hypothetical protein